MHWRYKLDSDDYTGCRLPDSAKQFAKPADWKKKTRPLSRTGAHRCASALSERLARPHQPQ